MKIINNDCIEAMKAMPENSVDSIVTDPPYELGFMGKKWDSTGIAFNTDVWKEALRVLKPGGHLIAFSGSRTYHRMAVAIEDAGFEIRDQIMWIYGSGFPKSLDVSKAIDKGTGENRERQLKFTEWMRNSGLSQKDCAKIIRPFAKNDETASAMAQHYYSDKQQPAIAVLDIFNVLRPYLPEVPEEIEQLVVERTGIEWTAYKNREVIGQREVPEGHSFASERFGKSTATKEINETAPATAAAKQWQGWGTALKPAHEPMVLARKPLIGTVAANVLEYGTGGLNIDGGRVEGEVPSVPMGEWTKSGTTGATAQRSGEMSQPNPQGRFPANVIHDGSDEVVGLFPTTKSGDWKGQNKGVAFDGNENGQPYFWQGDSGSAARFFYCAKASKRDRNEGLDGFEAIRVHDGRQDGNKGGSNPRNRTNTPKVNHHPTVKPTDLMRYLCRLITPPKGIVLDPFMGSGSTGKAAIYEGFDFIGIDQSAEYCEIAKARIEFAENDK